ncbi:MAG: UDP-N-acetylglucosamine 2-epimerase (non-hydrolyzing), partial [Aliifodinibius sp.]|nr:UDP-N-acetyl glucosamine 2-epimerase [Fodinibius sp.]NIV13423.1 UDP-N-acetylglucosamine 2-epimerase (non-hydrolyzing) [Fodinibius sp.]NIY27161.1 UDP-N-acetylglucosamine 2-epimerase (non-hydrolyzing) [Fodinibius sp.]
CDPLDYFEFVRYLTRCYMIVTDLGGIQEEASALGKPVFLLRKETESIQAIEAGVCRLIGTKYESIVEEISRLLKDLEAYLNMAWVTSIYYLR